MLSDQALLAAARAARERAYAPYSAFKVGAALLTEEGRLFTGANIENASYGLTICAERTAVAAAVNAGCRHFKRIAIVADCAPPPSPCGACRQVLAELAPRIDVVMGNLHGAVVEHNLAVLLPDAFRADQLRLEAGGDPAEAEEWRLPLNMNPIGYVENDFREPRAVPKNYRELLSRIVIAPDLEEGLYRIEEEQLLIVIAYLHRSRGYALKEERRGRGGAVYGVFACRTSQRPNKLALTEVELVKREGNILTVRGLDLINGTPVLDLKPVIAG